GPFSQSCDSNSPGSGSVVCSADISACQSAELSFSYSWSIEKYMANGFDMCSVSASVGSDSFSETVNDRYMQTNNADDCTGSFSGSDS
ncbi:MAG: hypothetical protein DRO99_01920, partial [Candidatus Aenigmatarchaeota archaeon]